MSAAAPGLTSPSRVGAAAGVAAPVPAPAVPGVVLKGPMLADYAGVLTAPALEFVARLQRTFDARRLSLLERRRAVQAQLDRGEPLRFLEETRSVREASWKVAPLPGGPAGPARGDHRPGRPQDGHQRAELGRQRVHGRLRGREQPHLGQRGARPAAT